MVLTNYDAIVKLSLENMVEFLLSMQLGIYEALDIELTPDQIIKLKKGIRKFLLEKQPEYLGEIS